MTINLFGRSAKAGTGAGLTSIHSKDRGALLVEFALIAPLLIMFVLGTVTMGMSYNRSISLNNSARESARYGATLPVDDDLEGWLSTIANVARDSAAGDLNAGSPGQEICVAYVYPDGAEAQDRTLAVVETAGTRTVLAGATCFEDGRGSGERRVQVTVRRESDVTTGAFSFDRMLTAQSVARFERS